MKAKNQPQIHSEAEAKEKLIVYVYEYLQHSGAKRAAQCFLEDIHYDGNIQITECPGFLANWWCVFWDLYCAAPEKRNQSEPSSEARAFHEYNMRSVMSPSCPQTSPSQQGPPFMGAGGPMMGGGGPRYGPHSGQLRGGPMGMGQRMPMGGPPPPPQMAGPHPPHPSMMGAGSPRYAPHPGHMTPGSSASSVGMSGPEPGPSPTMNRMTPNHTGSPHPQVVPPNGMGPMSVGPPPGGPLGGPPPTQPMIPGGSVQTMQQRVGPPQSWQGNFNVNSPAEQQQIFMPGPPVPSNQPGDFGVMMMNDGMMEVKPNTNNNGPPNQQQQDEYLMPGYGSQGDHSEAGPEIMKLKETLESNSKEYNENDQSAFSIDYPPEHPNKPW